VQEGESLSSIAADYGVNWSSVYDFNRSEVGINPNVIHPDTTILIPLDSKLVEANYPSYKLEIWLFLVILGWIAYIFKTKTFNTGSGSINVIRETVSNDQPRRKSSIDYGDIDEDTGEVGMEIKHNYIVPDADEIELQPEEKKGKVKTQVDKLKKIRGK
tara:strand:- start:190 stop:666 length:477 start_codon:yes stop_codon:yes gene_type:complete